MVSVYVSSTYRDLKEYRDAVISALRRMNHHVVCMEEYGAADQRPLERCLRDVDQCDVYVGIFAWQYGYAPQEDNPAGRSITELEYRRARDAKKQCLIFLLEDDHPWSPSLIDNGSPRARVEALRQELCKRHLVSKHEPCGAAPAIGLRGQKGKLRPLRTIPSLDRIPTTAKQGFHAAR